MSISASGNLQPLVSDGHYSWPSLNQGRGLSPCHVYLRGGGGGGLCGASTTGIGANLVSDILIETRVQLVAEKLTAPRWLLPVRARRGLRHTTR